MIALTGARIRRVDRPTRELVTLELAAGERAVLLLSATAGATGAGLVPQRPRGRPIDGFGLLLRKKLEGGTIVGLEAEPRGSRLVVDGPDGIVVLEALYTREGRGYRLLDAAGHRLHETARDLAQPADARPVDEASLEARGRAIADAIVEQARALRLRALTQTLERACTRVERAIAAVSADRERIATAAELRHEADLLMSLVGDDRAGRASIEVLDYLRDPPENRAIVLDPSRRPRQEAERRYLRARKLERGATIADARREKLVQSLAPLRALLERARACASDADVDAVEAELGARGLAPTEVAGTRDRATGRIPYREFRSARGVAIWVGKGAADNDELTIRLARPHHLFLHARGTTGAHVIVAIAKGATCDESTLADAATLAAHFSDARGEPQVEVQHTERRHVRKRKGSPAGAVQVDREKVMLLRLEPGRLARLLETEIVPSSKRKRPRES